MARWWTEAFLDTKEKTRDPGDIPMVMRLATRRDPLSSYVNEGR